MDQFYITLLLCIFRIIYLVEAKDPVTLYEENVEAGIAAQSLDKIQPGEALPFILFKPEISKMRLPTKLEKATILDGRMIQGTKFINDQFKHHSVSDQMFFCPDKNSDKQCLSRKTFDGNQPLQCSSEATPDIEWDKIGERDDEKGSYYSCIYRICDENDKEFGDTENINMYRMYHNQKLRKTLFTIHEITSPMLLNAKLLLREREVNYPMISRDEFGIFNSQGFGISSIRTNENRKIMDESTKPNYKWQKLVPSEDMALGLWRRSTFQEMNTALQHENLNTLWNKISEYVRIHAINKFINDESYTMIHTGVFDVSSPKQNKNEGQLSNIWVKMVWTTTSTINNILTATHGVAILMNNFVGTETSLNSNAIEAFCGTDYTIEALSEEFKEVKGRVRVCEVTNEILDLFNESHYILQKLYIPGINFVPIVTDDSAAGQPIGGIKSNELRQRVKTDTQK